MREYWLDIAYHLHMHPRDQERLTIQEWHEAVSAVKQLREEAKKTT